MWSRSKSKEQDYEGNWFEVNKVFENKFKYRLLLCIDKGNCYVMLASSNKRKYMDTFDVTDSKKTSSLKGLLWVRDRILNIQTELDPYYYKMIKRIVVGYADSRRRVVYKRGLISQGFREGRIQGVMCLVKNLK